MKNAVGTATNQGNVNLAAGETTKIHEAAYGVLMDMLSNIYSNAAKAVLREYSCNGWDEHRKHSVERPVEVTLPSLLQPTLVIRDFGTAGLSRDRVMEVFGTYGLSTKRDSDEEVGGFGIGSKAAFALGHQFMVTGYKDGQMFSALFTLNNDGTGSCSVVYEGPTEQPNGVEVSLGVDDVDNMVENARQFFQFWDRGDVLVDGEEPTPIFERLERISDEIFIDPEGRGEAFAVMGPVAYPIDRPLLRKVAAYLEEQGLGDVASLPLLLTASNTDLYIRVPIGGVVPAPSREALRDKERSVHTIGAVFYTLHQESAVKVQAEVDAAPSRHAAARIFHEANETLGAFKISRKAVSWKGQPLSRTAPVNMVSFTLRDKSWRSDTKVVGQVSHTALEVPQAEKSLVVVGVPDPGVVRRFVKRFLEDNEEGVEQVFVTDATAASFGWFQFGVEGGARTMTLDEWRAALRTMRAANPRTVNEPSYTTGFARASRNLDDRDLLSDILNEGKDIVVFQETAKRLNRFEREVLADYTVVVLLPTQSKEALHKRCGAAESEVKIVPWADLQPQAKALAQDIVNSVTDQEREGLGARAWLAENRSDRSDRKETLLALQSVGEVTAKPLLTMEDSYVLADEYATAVSDERYLVLSEAFNYAGAGSLDDLAVEYDDSLVDLHETYPLLNGSKVRMARTNLKNYTEVEDGVRVVKATRSWYYDEKKMATHLRFLEHSLAYVNAL